MTIVLRVQYETALRCAAMAISKGNKTLAVEYAKGAMKAANASKDARYRRAAFRVLNTVRAI